jgi:uncharacterized protein (TIGR00730 family)
MNPPKTLSHGTQWNANLFESSPSMNKETWRIFRIMSEFVDGFESLWHVQNAIAVFGSARAAEDDPGFLDASAIACGLGHLGFSIITGGGPGIMQAANKGGFESPAESIGLNIDLPHEQNANPYLDTDLDFRYFFVRKVMFVKFSAGFVMMPGGFGTLDEMFEVLTLIQTRKIQRVPVVFYNSDFWGPLVDWMREKALKEGMIDEKDLSLFKVLDTPEDTVNYFRDYYHIID